MRRFFKKCLTFSFILSLYLSSSGSTLARTMPPDPTGSNSQVHVLVYNYAPVSPVALAKAEERANIIFLQVGVQVIWVNHAQSTGESQSPPTGRANLDEIDYVFRILPRSRAVLKDSALGEALPCQPDEVVCFANVFYNRVEQRTEVERISLEQVLGHAMAHELGHLLLGSNSHSPTGIMSGKWRAEELKRAAKGDLLFTAQQAEVIRHNMQAKLSSVCSGKAMNRC